MSQFIYCIAGARRSGSPERMQQIMQKWMAWMKELGDKGHLKDSGPAARANVGKIVKGKQKAVTDGPFAEAKDVDRRIHDCRSHATWTRRCSSRRAAPSSKLKARWKFDQS